MAELDREREALRRAESSIRLSMGQPTVASRIDALQRGYDGSKPCDRDVFVAVVLTHLAIMGRCEIRSDAIRYQATDTLRHIHSV